MIVIPINTSSFLSRLCGGEDPVRAKLYRAYGDALKADKPTDAIAAYEKAIAIYPDVGCKTDLSKLKAAQG